MMWAISKGWAWISLFGPDEQEGSFDLEGPSTFVIPSLKYRVPHHRILGGTQYFHHHQRKLTPKI